MVLAEIGLCCSVSAEIAAASRSTVRCFSAWVCSRRPASCCFVEGVVRGWEIRLRFRIDHHRVILGRGKLRFTFAPTLQARLQRGSKGMKKHSVTAKLTAYTRENERK